MKYKIYSNDGVYFEYQLANVFSRGIAFIVDIFSIIALSNVAMILLQLIVVISPELFIVVMILYYGSCIYLYFISIEIIWRGQTIGKRLMKIRVVDAEGHFLTKYQIILRNLIRAVDMLPALGLLGGIVAYYSKSNQRLGDMISQTIVVDENYLRKIDFSSLPNNKYNSFLQYPHLCAKLRKVILPEEAHFIYEVLSRRDYLKSSSKLKLFDEIKTYFQSKIKFPEEETLSMSSQQYLMNICSILYQNQNS